MRQPRIPRRGLAERRRDLARRALQLGRERARGQQLLALPQQPAEVLHEVVARTGERGVIVAEHGRARPALRE